MLSIAEQFHGLCAMEQTAQLAHSPMNLNKPHRGLIAKITAAYIYFRQFSTIN